MSAEPGPGEGREAGPPPWSGPWADDVRRIFEIVQGHVSRPRGAEADAGPAEAGGHPPECAYCPICQGIAAVRRSGPETLDRIAELAAGLAATLRATDPARPAGAAAGGDRMADAPVPATPRPTPPDTVRIDVTE